MRSNDPERIVLGCRHAKEEGEKKEREERQKRQEELRQKRKVTERLSHWPCAL